MSSSFLHTPFGKDGPTIFRLGLSGTYRPGKEAIRYAVDNGVNFFFAYGFDLQTVKVLRDIMKGQREKFVIATGAYNLIWTHQNVRKTLEKRLRQFKTDYIDTFLFLGVMKEKEFTARAREDLIRLREQGKVRRIGLSTHDRKFAGKLADEGILDAFMIRYNAAHRGAEIDIFPYLIKHDPGLISYTATRWSFLLRPPKGYPKEGRIPTAGECYRFVLSNPHVDVVLNAPRNFARLKENLDSLQAGPLSEEDMNFMRDFGDRVHHTKKYFM